jgi:hypothetical protein
MKKAKGGPNFENYGKKEVLDDHRYSMSPERNLWASVIFQAILDVNYRVSKWEDSLRFLQGGKKWEGICQILDLNPKRASEASLTLALGERIKFAKRG